MMPTDIIESPWLRVDEAAAYCKVHEGQIYKAARERKLEHVRVGGRRTLLTKRDWCDNWLASLTVHVAPIGGGQ
jgi:excisionase family DNA binding protein